MKCETEKITGLYMWINIFIRIRTTRVTFTHVFELKPVLSLIIYETFPFFCPFFSNNCCGASKMTVATEQNSKKIDKIGEWEVILVTQSTWINTNYCDGISMK